MECDTVDGRNPAPPGMYKTTNTYQLVQDSFHQQHVDNNWADSDKIWVKSVGKKHLVKDGQCWITNQLTSQQVPNTPWLTAPIDIYGLGFNSINQRLRKNKEQKNNTIIPLKPQNNLQECASVGLERTSVLSCCCSDVWLRNPLIKRCKRQDVSIGIQSIYFPPKNKP